MSAHDLWRFFPLGYLFTILIETPILLIGLSSRHPIRRRLFAGVWLTACTYPIVVLVMPLIFRDASRTVYLTIAETFAPVAECALFWLAYGKAEALGKRSMWQDFGVIVIANLASFLGGEILNAYGWFGLLG
jgi:4-amino-4-deoxy-L-arabinose transferase-like glycosyltransferase